MNTTNTRLESTDPVAARIIATIDASVAELSPEEGTTFQHDVIAMLEEIQQAQRLIETLPDTEDRNAVRSVLRG